MDTKINLIEYLTIRPTSEFIIDETQLKVGSEIIWLWIATIESETKNILAISLSKERNMFLLQSIFYPIL
ncbi:MAG TPA: hypothetical protein VIY08_05155 [Candidatus Nitrosocosmicus sp.]